MSNVIWDLVYYMWSMKFGTVSSPLIYGGTFWFSKKNFEGGWIFVHLKGRESMGRLAKGGFNFKKLNCILILSLSRFSKMYSCIILSCIILSTTIVSKNWTWLNNNLRTCFLTLLVWWLFDYLESLWPLSPM